MNGAEILLGAAVFGIWAMIITTVINCLPKFHKYRVRIRRCTIDGIPYWCVETKPTLIFWTHWRPYSHFEDYFGAYQSFMRLKRLLP